MRPKFVFALFLSVLIALGTLFSLKRATTKPELSVDSGAKTMVSIVVPSGTASPTKLVRPLVVGNPITPEEHQAAVEAEVERLHDLSANNDAASLAAILSELTSPDKAVRLAAIEAAKQFGSVDAIPTLTADAAAAQSPEEQTAMLEAANILSLPDMTLDGSGTGTPETPEQIQADQQKYAAMQARRQAQLQAHGGSGQSQQAQPGSSATSSGGVPGN